MIVNLKLPDELWADYAAMDPKVPQRAIEKQLERFRKNSIADRILPVGDQARRELEKLRGRPIESAEDLISWIRERMTVDLGEVELALSEDQLVRLKTRADFHRQTPAAHLSQLIKSLLSAHL